MTASQTPDRAELIAAITARHPHASDYNLPLMTDADLALLLHDAEYFDPPNHTPIQCSIGACEICQPYAANADDVDQLDYEEDDPIADVDATHTSGYYRAGDDDAAAPTVIAAADREKIRAMLDRRYRGAIPVSDEMVDAVCAGLIEGS
jgi:hypothetical protein